jgi:hypothetical protein
VADHNGSVKRPGLAGAGNSNPPVCGLPMHRALLQQKGTNHAVENKYSNELIAKLISIFTDVEERRYEREESSTLIRVPS